MSQCVSVRAGQSCLEQSIFIFLGQRSIREHLLYLSFLKISIKFRKVDSCKSFKWSKETEACLMGGLVDDSVSGIGDR